MRKPEMLRCVWPPPSPSSPPAGQQAAPSLEDVASPQQAESGAAALALAATTEGSSRPSTSPPQAGSKTSVRQPMRLAWTLLLQEGDVMGLLVTPFGSMIVTVNGERRLLIPDAGVPNDVDLYPLVEVYNHVRSVQLVQRPAPPPTPAS